MPCVLEDICVWISGYYKPNGFSNHFLPVLILQFCCYHCIFFFFFFFFHQSSYCNFVIIIAFLLVLLITGSHIVLISMLGRLWRFLWPSIYAASLSLRIFQWYSLSMISTWSHRGRWSPFSLHMWSATPDFSTSPRVTVFWCSWSFTWRGRPVSPLYFLPQLDGIVYTQSFVMFSSMEISTKCCQAFEGCPDVPLYFLW